MSYQADSNGYYGEFGGAFIPEMLFPNTEEIRKNYIQILEDPSFQDEFRSL
jgi:tryptophan synthase beta chain